MDAEVGLPGWFTQVLLFSAAALAAIIAYHKKKHDIAAWTGIAVILLYLSIDEGIALHEMVAAPIRTALHIVTGPLIFAWTIPAIVVVGIVALFFLRFFLRQSPRTRLLLGAAAATYVVGALGMEVISGFYWSEQEFVFDYFYRVLTAIEEGLENTGVILAIAAFADVFSKLKTRGRN